MSTPRTAKLQSTSRERIRRMQQAQGRRLAQIDRQRQEAARRRRASSIRRAAQADSNPYRTDPLMQQIKFERIQAQYPDRRCLRTGDYFTCLTDSQWAKLFGHTRKNPKRYGCGAYACVYQSRNPGKVVKLTSDPGDLTTTIRAQGIPGVVQLYRAVAIDGQPERWALEVEKLRPLTRAQQKKFDRIIDCTYGNATDPDVGIAQSQRECCTKGRRAGTDVEGMDIYIRKRAPVACRKLNRFMFKVTSGLRARGLEMTDWHPGNVARDAQGNWKLIDLGHNIAYAEPRPYLKGPGRR